MIQRVLSRLEEQLKKRLSERKPEDSVAVLLDPLTKPYAKMWLGPEGYIKARNLLKKQHRRLYVKVHTEPSEAEVQEEFGEEAQQLEDIPPADEGPSIIDEDAVDLTACDDEEVQIDYDAEADKLFDKWMNFNPKFNDFLYEDVEKITNMGKCTITELIDKFDTAKYFQVRRSRTLTQLTFTFHTYHLSVDMQNHGKKNFFTISILSRIHLSRFETGSEQERVFSSGKKAMDKDQTNMDFEMLRIRTLLSHNRQLIRQGVISISG